MDTVLTNGALLAVGTGRPRGRYLFVLWRFVTGAKTEPIKTKKKSDEEFGDRLKLESELYQLHQEPSQSIAGFHSQVRRSIDGCSHGGNLQKCVPWCNLQVGHGPT
ncbi:hypothetical protein Fot_06417 [Forsythia ovata]|uniref:Uncharacterized protein n=1 Tax=Forsythia ovata TaxID=205694 RepID=A0ABD1WVW3_9LAMI